MTARAAQHRVTSDLAARVAALRPAALPADEAQSQSLVVLDAVACAIAGRSVDVARKAEAAATAFFSPRATGTTVSPSTPCTVLATGETATPAVAAFANGCDVHSCNFDANGPRGGHVALVALAPLLAVAEASPRPVSGRAFILASAVASEVADRLAGIVRAAGPDLRGRRDGGWQLGQVLGYVAAALGAGRVLAQPARQLRSAISLAVAQTAGTRQLTIEGDAPAKACYGGLSCHGGVLAAFLAHAGVEADVAALEGTAGFGEVFFDLDAGALHDGFVGFGEEWSCGRAAIKRWPASGHVQPYVDASLEILRSADASEIVDVEVVIEEHLRDWVEPLAQRRAPGSTAVAGNSIPYAVACALARGALVLRDVLHPTTSGDVRRLASTVTYSIGAAAVVARLDDGRTVAARCHDAAALGRPDANVVTEKLIRANDAAGRHIATPVLEAFADRILHIADLDDVRSAFRIPRDASES